MHSSLSFLVSGQAQQIFFFGFESEEGATVVEPWSFCDCKETTEEEFCIGNPSIVKGQKIFYEESKLVTRDKLRPWPNINCNIMGISLLGYGEVVLCLQVTINKFKYRDDISSSDKLVVGRKAASTSPDQSPVIRWPKMLQK
ncbi:unnamed protein product [Fraxinus pennsylvanica]|uniref:Uncharacterized protein n=1 Tax=Fraxinus pennsylvanica TaxID=56036 RepID=A0AAD1ZQ26_9LAMI|nr:unnamed protein product [Fraxinus pennsylvanica]